MYEFINLSLSCMMFAYRLCIVCYMSSVLYVQAQIDLHVLLVRVKFLAMLHAFHIY